MDHWYDLESNSCPDRCLRASFVSTEPSSERRDSTHIGGWSEGVLNTVVLEPFYPLFLALEQFLFRSCPLLLCSWLCKLCQVKVTLEAS
jgi:hypothetical protein